MEEIIMKNNTQSISRVSAKTNNKADSNDSYTSTAHGPVDYSGSSDGVQLGTPGGGFAFYDRKELEDHIIQEEDLNSFLDFLNINCDKTDSD